MTMQTRTIRLIQDILRANVTERPDKVALICENRRLTYAQIDAMADRLANAFRKNGVQDGDRILFHLLNSSELVVSIFAALKANAVFSVIDYANTFDTLRYIAADCEAAAVVTYDHQAESAARLLQDVPSLRFAVLTGRGARQPVPNLLAFDAIQEDYPPDPPPQSMIDRDLAYLIYTSGTTGKPKGVLVTHRSSLFTIESGIEYLGLSEDDIHASPLPLSFSPGINQLLQTFRIGGTLILERSFAYPVMTLKRMAAEGATGFAGVPTILALLLQMDSSRYDLSRLRYVSSIGAALAPSIIQQIRQRLPRVAIFSTYGMAEASYSLGLEPAQIDQRPTSVGKPFPGTQAWIIEEDGRRLGPDQIGELVVRGGHIRSGYWNDSAATAQRFRPGSIPGELVCFTGDVFRMDEEGYFYFVGRSDEIIKSGAKKVAPKEIENALYGLSGVLEAAAIGVPDPLLGQVIKAIVVLSEQARSSLTVQDILRHCHQTLEEFKVPRQIEIRDSLPKTPSGKIKKTDLA
ncbi:MAG: class I adenylate-forming enzyme family protein [Chloroflexi bacterium]|nr:class I adenylate-forming enzyme family protein [Chloroflexota bacterium]